MVKKSKPKSAPLSATAALPPITIRYMSIFEYATHRGVRQIDIRRVIASGRLHLEDNGLIDPVKADKAWAETAVPFDPGIKASTIKGADGKPVTFAQARTEAELLKQQQSRMRMAKMSGELVDRSKSINAVFGLARRERDAWQSWPARIAALMAAEIKVDAHALETTLDRYVREHLQSLADVKLDLR